MLSRFEALQATRRSSAHVSDARSPSNLAILEHSGLGDKLCKAAQAGDPEEVSYILEQDVSGTIKAALRSKDEPLVSNTRVTPLMLACIADGHEPQNKDHTQPNRIEVVKMLLKAGAEVNAVNYAGWTALFYSCFYAQEGITKMLLEAKADAMLEDNANKSAGSWARYGDSDQLHLKPVLKQLAKQGLPQSMEARVKGTEFNECVFHSPLLLNRAAQMVVRQAYKKHGGKSMVIEQIVGGTPLDS